MAESKIYLREEQREDYEEHYNYNIDIDIDIDKRGNFIIGSDYRYRRDFREGDIVTENNIDFGYVYIVKDDTKEVKVCWGYGINEWEKSINLLIIPYDYGMSALYNTAKRAHTDDIVFDWLKTINGFSTEEKDCLFSDVRFPKVNFIKYSDDSSLYDEKIDRRIMLYREIGNYKLYKASMFNGSEIRSWDKVFYILDTETKEVYFGGLKDEVKVTLAILYNEVQE